MPKIATSVQDFAGKKILITAGPTREYIDPVRFISNPSTGKMGFALAEAAARRGAQVILVTGPVQLETPAGIKRIDVVSGQAMFKACQKDFKSCDIFIATAAVGDYRAQTIQKNKIKKSNNRLRIEFIPNVDILQTLAEQKKPAQIIVGFAAETNALIKNAQKKLLKKNLDLIVANDVSKKGIGFGSNENSVMILDSFQNKTKTEKLSKIAISNKILDLILQLLQKKQSSNI